jgi:hypothetical protein
MAARKRSPVTPCAVVAWLTAGPPPRPLGLQRVAGRLTARLWRRRLSLFGLLLLTVGGIWIEHGPVAGGGWGSSILQAVVWLEVVLVGVVLLRSDLGELTQRVLRRQAGERQHERERRAKARWREGPR